MSCPDMDIESEYFKSFESADNFYSGGRYFVPEQSKNSSSGKVCNRFSEIKNSCCKLLYER